VNIKFAELVERKHLKHCLKLTGISVKKTAQLVSTINGTVFISQPPLTERF